MKERRRQKKTSPAATDDVVVVPCLSTLGDLVVGIVMWFWGSAKRDFTSQDKWRE